MFASVYCYSGIDFRSCPRDIREEEYIMLCRSVLTAYSLYVEYKLDPYIIINITLIPH